MKKSLFLIVPISLILASCTEVNFIKGEHSAGLEKSLNNSQNQPNSYQFFSGDNLEIDGLGVARFTFLATSTTSNVQKEDLGQYINLDNTSVTYTIEDSQYVGTKEGIGLFIGIDTSYIDGYLSLTLDKPVKAVIVKARRYYYEGNGFDANIVSDNDVALAINDSRYIKLSSSKDESGVPEITECRYSINNKNTITLKAGPKRAFIEEIACYF